MNSKKIETHKSLLQLTKMQREIVSGLVFGDGCLETQDGGKTYRLKVEHSLKQKDYVEWLYNYLKDWVPGGIYTRDRGDKGVFVGFQTYSHSALRFYGHQFYPKGKKVIPKSLKTFLTPLSIAIWFMDDGSKKSLKHNTYIIHTLGYSKDDLERVTKIFKTVFDIDLSIHSQKKKYWRLYVQSGSSTKFRSLIFPIVSKILSMTHKLDNKMPKE